MSTPATGKIVSQSKARGGWVAFLLDAVVFLPTGINGVETPTNNTSHLPVFSVYCSALSAGGIRAMWRTNKRDIAWRGLVLLPKGCTDGLGQS